MNREKTDKTFYAITANGCRDMDEVRFHQAINEAIESVPVDAAVMPGRRKKQAVPVCGQIKVSDVLAHIEWRVKINEMELEDIILLSENGNKIEISKNKIARWKFTGLNNIDFIAGGFYKN